MTIRSRILGGVLALGAITTPATAAVCYNNPTVVGEACYIVNTSGGGGGASTDPLSGYSPPVLGDIQAFGEANDVNGGTVRAWAASQGAYAGAEASIAWLIMPELNPGQTATDELIPMRAVAEGSWSYTGTHGGITAFFGLQQDGKTLFSGNYNTPFAQGTVFRVDQIFWVRPDVPIRVDIQATANTRIGFTGLTEAVVDPVFEIVGDYALRYTMRGLLGDASVPPGGGGAVPEPATWALMIAGFGLAGASLRRRKRAAA